MKAQIYLLWIVLGIILLSTLASASADSLSTTQKIDTSALAAPADSAFADTTVRALPTKTVADSTAAGSFSPWAFTLGGIAGTPTFPERRRFISALNRRMSADSLTLEQAFQASDLGLGIRAGMELSLASLGRWVGDASWETWGGNGIAASKRTGDRVESRFRVHRFTLSVGPDLAISPRLLRITGGNDPHVFLRGVAAREYLGSGTGSLSGDGFGFRTGLGGSFGDTPNSLSVRIGYTGLWMRSDKTWSNLIADENPLLKASWRSSGLSFDLDYRFGQKKQPNRKSPASK